MHEIESSNRNKLLLILYFAMDDRLLGTLIANMRLSDQVILNMRVYRLEMDSHELLMSQQT